MHHNLLYELTLHIRFYAVAFVRVPARIERRIYQCVSLCKGGYSVVKKVHYTNHGIYFSIFPLYAKYLS